jgi:hypothetical protein
VQQQLLAVHPETDKLHLDSGARDLFVVLVEEEAFFVHLLFVVVVVVVVVVVDP